MYLLTNKSNRAIGLPCTYRSVVLGVDDSEEVTEEHWDALCNSQPVAEAYDKGMFAVERLDGTPSPKPDRGVKLESKGGGWWIVYVNGYPVSEKAVRKEEAERMAEEYQ